MAYPLTPYPKCTLPGVWEGYVYRGQHVRHDLRTGTWEAGLRHFPSGEAAMQFIDDLAAPLPPRPLPAGFKVTFFPGERMESASAGRNKAERARGRARAGGHFAQEA